MKFKLRRFIKIVLVNLLIIVLGVVVLELYFGDWFGTGNLNKLNVIRSTKLKYRVQRLYDYPRSYITYTRDKYGLRGSFKDPGEIDILTVGGSTTNLRYINDGETWQDVIQNNFNEIGKDVVVANAGIEGASSVSHVRKFDWWFPTIPELKPKYVLFYIGINDVFVKVDRWYKYDGMNKKKNLWSKVGEKSGIYHVIRTLYGHYRATVAYRINHRGFDFSKSKWTTVPLQNSYDVLLEENLRDYAERLRILIEKTRELGAMPIFVTQPVHMYRIREGVVEGVDRQQAYKYVFVNGVDMYYIFKMFNEVTMSVCEEQRAICLDLASDTIWEDSDFYDFLHMPPRGIRKVGEHMFEKLKELY